jgi:uncharacterized membrane protein
MRLKKRTIIIIGVVVALLLAGTIAGVAYAQTGTDTGTGKTFVARVAEILGIDQQKVQDAFTQAQKEMQNEALDKWLNNMVSAGRMTQAQADEYKQWIQARPDVPGVFGPGPMMRGGFRGGCWGWGGGLPQQSTSTQ